jgi:NhaA family Na+:H+ antiporter
MSDSPRLMPEVGEQDHVYGSLDAPLILVQYGDIGCPHCIEAHEIIREVKQRLGGQYAFVFRHFPLQSKHPHAQMAAEAVEAAGAQGKYWEMLAHLFQHQDRLDQESLVEYAAELELDVDQFRGDLQSRKYKKRVDDDYHNGLRSGVNGTPTFFVNGVRYDGPWDVESLIAEIEKPLGVKVRNLFQRFASFQASGGILLVLATMVALFLANSPWAEQFFHFWETEVSITLGSFTLSHHVREWVNDGLMALFFLVVGLEIKREITVGELASPRRAALPVAAALGGMVVPVAIFLLFNAGTEAAGGWAIPMATDIAFALGILTLLGDRVPLPLRIFFAAIAIADDLGAVVILAVFYSEQIVWPALAISGLLIVALIGLNRAGVRRPLPYGLLGIALWLAVLQSGAHPTIAGFALALTIPARTQTRGQAFPAQANAVLSMVGVSDGIEEEEETLRGRRQTAAHTLEMIAERMQAPAQRMEHALTPWSTYLILPLFALANTGVALNGGDVLSGLSSPLSMGIIFGLVLGKGLGLSLFSWIAVRLGIAQLPSRVSWGQLVGASSFAGIGFTMSLFISGSAFGGTAFLDSAKISILFASAIAIALGMVMTGLTSERRVGRSEASEVPELQEVPVTA